MDRLYLKRNELGKGLTCVVEKAEVMTLNLFRYLEENPKTKPLADLERELGSHMGSIVEFLRLKYEIDDEVINSKTVYDKQKECRLRKIDAKVIHGLLFKEDDNRYDRKESSMWLLKGNIFPSRRECFASYRTGICTSGEHPKDAHIAQEEPDRWNTLQLVAAEC